MIHILNFYLCKGVGSIDFTPLFYTQTILLPVVIQYIHMVACSHSKVSNCVWSKIELEVVVEWSYGAI